MIFVLVLIIIGCFLMLIAVVSSKRDDAKFDDKDKSEKIDAPYVPSLMEERTVKIVMDNDEFIEEKLSECLVEKELELEEALENEHYEHAAKLRDEIEELKETIESCQKESIQ